VDLDEFLRDERLVRNYGNVMVVERGCHMSDGGPTEVACMLHAVAILLREFKGWNWFLNLDVSDYPLMPQDGKFLIPTVLFYSSFPSNQDLTF
jgi:beta-glucuronosyltransferase